MKLSFSTQLKQRTKAGLLVMLVLVVSFSSCKKKKSEDTPSGTDDPKQADTTMVFIKADHPEIQYTGRIDFSDVLAPAFSFPGISIKAKFKGAAIDVVIKDYASGTAMNTNYYNIIIDGNVHKVLKVKNTDTIYAVARGLADTEHTIEVFKRTESSVGKSAFKGFRILNNTSLLSLGAAPSRKMEFIGDSFTCGYGNDISYTSGTTTGFHSVYENNYIAWGALLSRQLNAQYMCTAYSGRGMYRNVDGSTSGAVPSFYNRIFPDAASPLWNAANYVPDIILIHLGTNDFAREQATPPYMVDSAQYVNAYIALVTTLRSNYSSAYIVCVRPNSLTDSYPVGLKNLTRITNYHQAVVNHFTTGGDNKVTYFALTPQTAPYGEDWHPSATTHVSMAAQIKDFIQLTMNW